MACLQETLFTILCCWLLKNSDESEKGEVSQHYRTTQCRGAENQLGTGQVWFLQDWGYATKQENGNLTKNTPALFLGNPKDLCTPWCTSRECARDSWLHTYIQERRITHGGKTKINPPWSRKTSFQDFLSWMPWSLILQWKEKITTVTSSFIAHFCSFSFVCIFFLHQHLSVRPENERVPSVTHEVLFLPPSRHYRLCTSYHPAQRNVKQFAVGFALFLHQPLPVLWPDLQHWPISSLAQTTPTRLVAGELCHHLHHTGYLL